MFEAHATALIFLICAVLSIFVVYFENSSCVPSPRDGVVPNKLSRHLFRNSLAIPLFPLAPIDLLTIISQLMFVDQMVWSFIVTERNLNKYIRAFSESTAEPPPPNPFAFRGCCAELRNTWRSWSRARASEPPLPYPCC